jgi:hypothetical protein
MIGKLTFCLFESRNFSGNAGASPLGKENVGIVGAENRRKIVLLLKVYCSITNKIFLLAECMW